MKTLKTTVLLLFTVLLFNCSSDDDSPRLSNAEQLMGKWELVDGNFLGNETKYVIFNGDNIKLLFQDEHGFKGRFDYDAIENVTETEFTFNTQGPIVYTYTIDGNTLTVTESIFNSTATFTRNNSSVTYDNWITTLNKEIEVNTPWTDATDIAYINFDGTSLILGYDAPTSFVSSINLATLSSGGGVFFNRQAFALTYDTDGDLFLNSNTNDTFLYATETDGTEIQSVDLNINMPINYLSYHNDNIWIASTSAKTIIFYNDLGQDEYILSKQPYGIEYSNGFLYISTGNYLHKCNVTNTQIQAIETYDISSVGSIRGITSGENSLWINTQLSGSDDKLIKTSLTF